MFLEYMYEYYLLCYQNSKHSQEVIAIIKYNYAAESQYVNICNILIKLNIRTCKY